MSHDFNVSTTAGFLLSFLTMWWLNIPAFASVFRVDTVNKHAAQKPKRLINNRSENLKTYI